jgi:cytochrome c-type biogenesis protein CcmF
VLLALAAIILTATLWPVISRLWGAQAQGLGADFYNRVCPPLFAVLTAMLALCPMLRWDGGLRDRRKALAVVVFFVLAAVLLWHFEYRAPAAFISSAAACACMGSMLLLFTERPDRNTLAAYGVHLGAALVVLGVAFSGPYKQEADLTLGEGESARLGAFEVRLTRIEDGEEPGYHFLEARLDVFREGEKKGELSPQRRIYDKFGRQQFAEADTVFSPGDEIYASLLGLEPGRDGSRRVTVKISVHPLVNWLWAGGVLMCLFPLAALRARGTTRTRAA